MSNPHLRRPGKLSPLSVTLLAGLLAIHEAARPLDAFSDMAAARHRRTFFCALSPPSVTLVPCFHLKSSAGKTRRWPALS